MVPTERARARFLHHGASFPRILSSSLISSFHLLECGVEQQRERRDQVECPHKYQGEMQAKPCRNKPTDKGSQWNCDQNERAERPKDACTHVGGRVFLQNGIT